MTEWLTLPEELRSKPATEEQLAAFERHAGTIPSEFRWFLATFGGGPVGTEWIDDVTKLRDTHAKFTDEQDVWTMRDCFVVGYDGGGNPMAIDHASGRMLVEDHDFGGIHEMAPSFEAFLVKMLTSGRGRKPS